PEAQLDRFAMKLSLGYPSPEDEQKMLAAAIGPLEQTVRSENALLSPAELRLLQNEIRKLHVAESIQRYMIQLGQATRQHTQIQLGASPRALLTWQRVCQARAYLEGRDFVTPDDVQATAVPVLSVRLGIISGNAQQLVGEIINETEVPRAGGNL
ncbi:MAG: AAA family ATPase, partial [Planctomycetota bacterium]